ncbi:MAG: DNA-3-methyladenine glycosylase 2 family protein [Lachnospiraceae bacterium]|nr:DNA-3-methyladenine glycosylase 2 family protein [Lachnospiraceae bacterium]
MKFIPGDDFDPARIADSGQCFRWKRLSDDTCRMVHAGRCLYAVRTGNDEYELDCPEEEFDSVWRDYFDLGENYAAIRGRIDPAKDPFLTKACEEGKGIRILRQDPFEALISFIISQNRNIPAIRNSIELLCRTAGEERTDNRGRTFYTFPQPEKIAALTDNQLAACRLGYRADYVRNAARAVTEGSFDPDALRQKSDEEAVTELTALYGVGRKVAGCMLLFGLHRLNAFPVDVWIRRVLENEYPLGYPMDEYAPYNGVYQQYMFAYYRNGSRKIKKA